MMRMRMRMTMTRKSDSNADNNNNNNNSNKEIMRTMRTRDKDTTIKKMTRTMRNDNDEGRS